MNLIAGDFHIPYHSEHMLRLSLKFSKDYSVDNYIINGDFLDFYSISSFDKNPERITYLQKEINQGLKVLKRIKRHVNNIIYIPGNHEQRLVKYLWRKAPELSSLDSLKIENLLKFKDLGVTFVKDKIVIDGILIMHGDLVSKHSAYSAKNSFEKYGTNTIINHTHRGGSFFKTDLLGVHYVYENFCMCDLDPEYMKYPNWQQGFSVINNGHIQQIFVNDDKAIFGNTQYKIYDSKILKIKL